MTEPEKQKLIEDSYWKLKRAAGMAETLKGSSLTLGGASTLLTLSTEAQAAVVYLRNIAAGNEPPKGFMLQDHTRKLLKLQEGLFQQLVINTMNSLYFIPSTPATPEPSDRPRGYQPQ